MTTNTSIRLFAFILLFIVVSCDKEENKIDKILDWTEYTDYIPLPEKDVLWINEINSEEIPEAGPVPYKYRTITNQYCINGDTSINNLLYKKVFNKRIIFTEDISENSETTDSMTVYSGGLRQNITDKKVYFIFASDNKERLLYDFDLEIGDSVYFYTTREKKGKISCIDSTLIGNRYHNVYYVQIGDILKSFYYMEGIGSFQGLIIELDKSLNGPWDIDFIDFEYKDEKININWNINTENCFD